MRANATDLFNTAYPVANPRVAQRRQALALLLLAWTPQCHDRPAA